MKQTTQHKRGIGYNSPPPPRASRARLLTPLIALLMSTVFSYTAPAQTLKAHWDFTNAFTIATDLSGYGHHGTVINATPTADCKGVPNRALHFGAGKWVQVPGSQDFCSGEWTINIIARLNSFNASGATCEWSTALSHEVRGMSNYYSIDVGDEPSGVSPCGNFSPPNQQMVAWSGGVPTTFPGGPGLSITPGCWYCFTAVYRTPATGTMIDLYVNGVPLTSYPWVNTFGAPCTPFDLLIGKGDYGGNPTWWEGDIDDIKWYLNAMTASQVASNFPCPCPSGAGCGTPPPPCTAMLDHIQFSGGTATPFVRNYTVTTVPAATGAVRWKVGTTTFATLPATGTFTHTFSAGTHVICAELVDPVTGLVCDTKCFETCISQTGFKAAPTGGGSGGPTVIEREIGKVFPNPTTGELNIPTNGWAGATTVTVTAMGSGKVVLRQKTDVLKSKDRLSIPTGKLPPGTYLVELRTGANVTRQTFGKL